MRMFATSFRMSRTESALSCSDRRRISAATSENPRPTSAVRALERGVEREQVGLVGDALDQGQDLADVVRAGADEARLLRGVHGRSMRPAAPSRARSPRPSRCGPRWRSGPRRSAGSPRAPRSAGSRSSLLAHRREHAGGGRRDLRRGVADPRGELLEARHHGVERGEQPPSPVILHVKSPPATRAACLLEPAQLGVHPLERAGHVARARRRRS